MALIIDFKSNTELERTVSVIKPHPKHHTLDAYFTKTTTISTDGDESAGHMCGKQLKKLKVHS